MTVPTDRALPPVDPPHARHSLLDDLQGVVTGVCFVAFGITLLRAAGLLTGGTAGLAFLVHYATGWRFGLVFFAINLPFYALALRQLGPRFTLKTFGAVALLSAVSEALPHWFAVAWLDAAFAAVAGGLLIGAGLLMLFRHDASLGGLNVLVLWLQRRSGLRAGWVQMGFDCAIVAASFAVIEPRRVALSVLGAVAINLVLALNHRPGRYVPTA